MSKIIIRSVKKLNEELGGIVSIPSIGAHSGDKTLTEESSTNRAVEIHREINKVIEETGDMFNIKMKMNSTGHESKWLIITKEQAEEIRKIVTGK